jgi:hypothetical protein
MEAASSFLGSTATTDGSSAGSTVAIPWNMVAASSGHHRCFQGTLLLLQSNHRQGFHKRSTGCITTDCRCRQHHRPS